MLTAVEFLPIEDPKLNKKVLKMQDKIINAEELSGSEDEFDWLSDDAFFVLYNQSRSTMPKNSQALMCYGERTNLFLMVNYGFCF